MLNAQLSADHNYVLDLISVRTVSYTVAAARTPHVTSSESLASASPCPEIAATSRRSVGGCDPRLVSPLGHHLKGSFK